MATTAKWRPSPTWCGITPETGSREIGPLKLSAAEQSDLVVFLESISTFNNPWRPEDPGRCF